MKIVLRLVAVVILAVAAFVVWIGLPKGPTYEEVAHLAEPRIASLDPQKVLVVTAMGDPNEVGQQAFGLLMKTYFGLEGVPKSGSGLGSPRARWPLDASIPAREWVGRYAIPVPDHVSTVSSGASKTGLTVTLEVWEYGEVAEILHVGSYDSEMPTIDRLKAFIQARGLKIVGEHEEEYLRGPGMIFRGNPDRYLTLIRYPVEPVSEST